MAKRMVDTNCWVRTFEVTEPTKHRKGFTVYKVTSVVFPRAFPESATKITVWKRYSDFRKLHKDLELIFKQLYLKGEFPVFPKAKVFGRFEHEVVEERRKAALTLLEFTANHTQLFTSKPFMQFFESGYNSQDFIGKILFRKADECAEDPPVTVLQEKSDISTPCLKPQVLWNEGELHTNDGDTISLSPSSLSSSISPTETTDMPATPSNEPKPCTSVVVPSDLVTSPSIGENSKVAGASETSKKNGISNSAIDLPSSTKPIEPHSSQASDTSSSCENTNHRQNGIVRSATVTDELSCYFDEEFEDAAFLFPTGSCSSLDTLPGFTASSDVVDSAQKKNPSNSRGLFTLSRKKSNGFGLFDFLPLFPKKSKKKSVTKEKEVKKETVEPVEEVKKTSLSVGYICEAAGHFAVAQFHESNTEYENAFAAYKEGIRVLLAGAQDDADRDRKLLAKNKLEKYLQRAESLKENFLSPGTSNCGTISPVFSSPSKKEKSLSSLNRHGKSVSTQNGKSLLCSIEELKPYKVVGVGHGRSKILIVMNPEEPNPKCYATKVLWKSPCIIHPEKPTVITGHIPFMVKLLKWFDTPDKIILLLEHAGGGRLDDFVKNYQSKKLSLSTPPEECSPLDEIKMEAVEYSAAKDEPHSQESESNCNDNQECNATCTGSNDLVFEIEKAAQLPSTPPNVMVAETEILSENEIYSTPAVSPPENEDVHTTPDNLDVTKLLENSKALLQTVSKTLEEGASPKRTPVKQPTTNESSKDLNTANNVPTSPTGCSIQQVLVEQTRKNSTEVTRQNSRKTSNVSEDFEDYVPLRMVPEGVVRVWAAEIVIALEALHGVGITYGNLHLNDVLLGENGHILLKYKSLWTEIDEKLIWNSYTAPEVRESVGIPLWKMHSSSDWWSLGVILFLLLTGQSLHSAHPDGIYPEMVIKVPDKSVCETPISKSAQTLLKEYSPEIRLGYYGAPEIKTHPFFDGFDWEKALDDGSRNDEEILAL